MKIAVGETISGVVTKLTRLMEIRIVLFFLSVVIRKLLYH